MDGASNPNRAIRARAGIALHAMSLYDGIFFRCGPGPYKVYPIGRLAWRLAGRLAVQQPRRGLTPCFIIQTLFYMIHF
jgi:hypothetical protein